MERGGRLPPTKEIYYLEKELETSPKEKK